MGLDNMGLRLWSGLYMVQEEHEQKQKYRGTLVALEKLREQSGLISFALLLLQMAFACKSAAREASPIVSCSDNQALCWLSLPDAPIVQALAKRNNQTC